VHHDNVHLMENIKTIGLIVKNNERVVVDNLERLSDFLIDKQYRVLLDESITTPTAGASIVNRETLAQESELVIVIGGDGTLFS